MTPTTRRQGRHVARVLGLLALIAALMVGAFAAARATAAGSSPSNPAGSAFQQTLVNVVNKVRPSVVEISTATGLGSGIVYDNQGDIVTNNHVVAGATQFQVTFSGGNTVPGTLVGTFPPDDLAVIKVAPPAGLAPATFADSTNLRVGDVTMAIGNPLGLASSVTQGIVSYTGRTVSEGGGVVLPDTVQTSAPINPGNSGGALVNIAGQVIGIPTLGATDPQLGGGAAPGIGFAIASNTAKNIAGQLVSQGRVTNSGRAGLGIVGATATNAQGQQVGVLVRSVDTGGPAAAAGIQEGDLVVGVNGQQTPNLSVLHEVLASLKPGDIAAIGIAHPDGSQNTVQVTLRDITG
jgi:S1-C subfamily serine protease